MLSTQIKKSWYISTQFQRHGPYRHKHVKKTKSSGVIAIPLEKSRQLRGER